MMKVKDYNREKAKEYNNPLETCESRLLRRTEYYKKKNQDPKLCELVDIEAKKVIEEFRELYQMAIKSPVAFRAIREMKEEDVQKKAEKEDSDPLIKKYAELGKKYIIDAQKVYEEYDTKTKGIKFSNTIRSIAAGYSVFIAEEYENYLPRKTDVRVKFANQEEPSASGEGPPSPSAREAEAAALIKPMSRNDF